jgi:LPXTG-site transpeptidase (sortase) family protein
MFVRSFAGVFIVLTGILFSIDFVPEPRVRAELATTTVEVAPTVTLPSVPEVTTPVRIRIQRIGVDTTIVTPQSTDIAVLDRALLSGAVHYPGSAEAGDIGNMLIFGHSSYLPVVKNKSFQAFNELGSLQRGEAVEVFSETHRYTYTVDSVALVRAENAQVPLTVDASLLTLATCNTFGAKQERWVVTAHLSAKESL